MRHHLSILLLFLFCSSLEALEINVETYTFKGDNSSYLEAYIRVIGNSVTFQEVEDGLLQSQIEVNLFVYNSEEEIIAYDRFVLNSPKLSSRNDFLDIRRFALPTGKYKFKMEAKDLNDKENNLELVKTIDVPDFRSKTSISSLQLLADVKKTTENDPLGKNGLAMEPLTYGYASDDLSILRMYTEIYQTINSKSILKYSIVEGFDIDDGSEIMKKYKKLEGKITEPILVNLPIDKIPSGNYHVKLEVLDHSKKVLSATRANFVRSNIEFDKEFWTSYNKDADYSFVNNMNLDSLDYSIKAIFPIASGARKNLINYILKKSPINAKRKFLFDFWLEESPEAPQIGYEQYMIVADYAHLEFNSNVGYGFETDRGYIFLRYGKPNNAVTVDTEPDSPPYEIWYYHFLEETTETNVRFLFYNPSLSHNDFSLLHSTCRNEKQNPAWEVELYRDAPDSQIGSTINATQVNDSWGRNARRYFNEY